MVEAFTASMENEDQLCSSLQLLSSYCGCPSRDHHCTFCHGEPLKEECYNFEMNILQSDEFGTSNLGVSPTCEVLYLTQFQLPRDGEYCHLSHFLTFHCGCNDGVFEYLGASTTKQHAAIAWIPRVVGIFSFVGAFLILLDILRFKRQRESLYHQIVVLVAIFDIITSVISIVDPAAGERINARVGLDAGVYGRHGTDATCKAQGFFFS